MFSFFKNIFSSPSKNKWTYKYRKMGEKVYPSIEVEFLINGEYVTYPAIVDSGADVSLIPRKMGEDLNLKKTQLRYLGGIGGRTGYYLNFVNIKLAGKEFTAPLAWMTHDDIPLLIGRKGIFDEFKICFDESRGVVSFVSK